MSYDEGRVAADLHRGQTATPVNEGIQPGSDPLAPSSLPESTAPASTGTSRAVREIVETLLLALVIFAGVRLVVLNFRVDGASMAPNLHNREMLLVNRNAYLSFDVNEILDAIPGVDQSGTRRVYPFDPPERGDIVVFNPPVSTNKPYIKRIVGLPGETIEIKEGYVFVDGQRLDEPYISGAITECIGSCKPETVPNGSVFVLGDNRHNSSDSRSFGSIAVDSIVGKAWFTYWPTDDIGIVPHFDYPGLSER